MKWSPLGCKDRHTTRETACHSDKAVDDDEVVLHEVARFVECSRELVEVVGSNDRFG